ncbi:MAG TPA: hypothetical protein VGJ14_17260 [Sporichthyaceae bacterium]|jgi:hypothetical protein
MRRITLGALVLTGALASPIVAAGPAGAADTPPPPGQSGGPSQPAPGDPNSQPPNAPAAPAPAPPTPGDPVGQLLSQILGGGSTQR